MIYEQKQNDLHRANIILEQTQKKTGAIIHSVQMVNAKSRGIIKTVEMNEIFIVKNIIICCIEIFEFKAGK